VGGAVALQPAAVSNERVAQDDSFSESGVAQRRQQAVGGGGIKSASAGGACMIRNCRRKIREGALEESFEHFAREKKLELILKTYIYMHDLTQMAMIRLTISWLGMCFA
jgi:hypothetical protein